MSDHIQEIKNLIQKNQGVITAREVKAAGISTTYLSIMVNQGLIDRIGRGLYAFKATYVDEMYELAATNNDIVFSHLSALYLHDLTDRTPLKMTITVPRTKNVSRLIDTGMVEVKRSNEKNHLLGAIEKKSPAGFPIKVYDMERTICDIVKNSKNMDPQIVNDALKRYVARKDKDMSKLMQYAEKLRAAKKVRQYMEVLL